MPKTRFGSPWISRFLYIVAGIFGVWAANHAVVEPAIAFYETGDILVALVLFGVGMLFMLPTVVLGLLGRFISHRYQKRQQKIRDERAVKVLANIKDGMKCDYSLYLRAFETTGQMPEITSPRQESREWESSRDIELGLAQAVEDIAPLVALGRPGEQVGVGRIATSDEEWKDAFDSLGSGARVVFLLPSTNPGTLDEIVWITKHRHWGKVILLMPPQNITAEYKWADRWEAMRSRLKQLGLNLPHYRNCGMVFRLNEQGDLESYQPLQKFRPGIQGVSRAFLAKNVVSMGPSIVTLMDGGGLKPGENLIECPWCGYCERYTDSSMIPYNPCHQCGYYRTVPSDAADEERDGNIVSSQVTNE